MKKIMKVIVAMMLLVATVFSMTGCSLFGEADSRPVCNLNDYVVVTEEGKSGNGNLYMTLDYAGIIRDFGQYIDYEAQDAIPEWLEYGVGQDVDAAIDALFNGVALNETLRTKTFNMVLSQETGLKNGDVVTVQWTDSPMKHGVLKELMPVKFTYSDFTHTMSKLESK